MTGRSGFRIFSSSSLLPLAAVALAAIIFVFDTITQLEIAVPAFYTAVVLISARFCRRRGLIAVGAGCIGLTLVSDFLTPGTSVSESGIINTAISVLAISATTYLALKIETAERAVYDARAQLTHVARLTTLGELTASIAHEVNQPIAANIIDANASLRWISTNPPNLDEARTAIERIVKDANRAAEVVARVRNLAKRAPPQKSTLDINDIILEIITLIASEIRQHRIALETDLSHDLKPIIGDRVQLGQVILNLTLNAIEAMDKTPDAARTLSIRSKLDPAGDVLVSVSDSGTGLEAGNVGRLFDAFHTTKGSGMGLGLTISRSIVESHGGRIWASPNEPRGASFQFTLPTA